MAHKIPSEVKTDDYVSLVNKMRDAKRVGISDDQYFEDFYAKIATDYYQPKLDKAMEVLRKEILKEFFDEEHPVDTFNDSGVIYYNTEDGREAYWQQFKEKVGL
jgi:hypothetical protein